MTDEHIQRYWADAHNEFTGDLDRGLLRLGHHLSRRLRGRQAIDKPYARATSAAVRQNSPKTGNTQAALAGLAACVATTVLLVTVALLATSGTLDAGAIPARQPVMSHMVFA